MNRRTPARQARMAQLLTEKALPRKLRRMLPRASNYTPPNYGELLRELNHFGITTLGQFRALLLRNRREALRIDRVPLDAANTCFLGHGQPAKSSRRRVIAATASQSTIGSSCRTIATRDMFSRLAQR
jgi:hypothetical protein